MLFTKTRRRCRARPPWGRRPRARWPRWRRAGRRESLLSVFQGSHFLHQGLEDKGHLRVLFLTTKWCRRICCCRNKTCGWNTLFCQSSLALWWRSGTLVLRGRLWLLRLMCFGRNRGQQHSTSTCVVVKSKSIILKKMIRYSIDGWEGEKFLMITMATMIMFDYQGEPERPVTV